MDRRLPFLLARLLSAVCCPAPSYPGDDYAGGGDVDDGAPAGSWASSAIVTAPGAGDGWLAPLSR